jgi:hypothetical protein
MATTVPERGHREDSEGDVDDRHGDAVLSPSVVQGDNPTA